MECSRFLGVGGPGVYRKYNFLEALGPHFGTPGRHFGSFWTPGRPPGTFLDTFGLLGPKMVLFWLPSRAHFGTIFDTKIIKNHEKHKKKLVSGGGLEKGDLTNLAWRGPRSDRTDK